MVETKNAAAHLKRSGLEIIYTLFLSILIALFFGLGVAAFYPAPESPEPPAILTEAQKNPEGEWTDAQREANIQLEKDQKAYQVDFAKYSRDVSIITLILAVLALAVSLWLVPDVYIISNALMLGGVFTLGYSIIRGFMTEDAKYRFVIVSIGLLVTLVLGYMKFIKADKKK